MVLTENFNVLSGMTPPPSPTAQVQQQPQPVASRGTADTLMDFLKQFLMSFTPAMNTGLEQLAGFLGGQGSFMGRVVESMIIRKGGGIAPYDYVDQVIQRAARGENLDEISYKDAGMEYAEGDRHRIEFTQQKSLEAKWAKAEEVGGFTDQGVPGNAPVTPAPTETPAQTAPAAKPLTPTGMV